MALDDILAPAGNQDCILEIPSGSLYAPLDILVTGTMVEEIFQNLVFPAEGDVDVTADPYGPTGAEYEGTLAQPVEGDVKLNVQYGANGTEFTGTYNPSGTTLYDVFGNSVIKFKEG